MLKNVACMEYKSGDRNYYFMCDNGAPLGEAHDAICSFQAAVVEKINENAKAAQPAPVENA